MTTLEPGASDVLTHGFTVRPRSTAFLATRPAASITEGFDVLVQLVMAAITTWPWSSSNVVPSSNFTVTALYGRSPLGGAGTRGRAASICSDEEPVAGGSLAGNVSATA